MYMYSITKLNEKHKYTTLIVLFLYNVEHNGTDSHYYLNMSPTVISLLSS